MTRAVEVLLVEDDPGHARLTQETLKEGNLRSRLHVVTDGEEALAFLHREEPYTQAIRPDIILLDLKLPKKDGCQVLAEIKADERLRYIPVIVLTTSAMDHDVVTAYDLHANCYLTKPIDADRFMHVVKSIEAFWTMAQLPRGEGV